jgi:hypothetical protein
MAAPEKLATQKPIVKNNIDARIGLTSGSARFDPSD